MLRHLEHAERRAGPGGGADLDRAQRSAARRIHRALLRRSSQRGQRVAKDDKIGHITDFHGKVLEQITAPFDGEILYVIGTPPISKGEPVAMIGARK